VADINRIASRPRRYLAETGVPQLVGGLGFLILGTSVLIQPAFPTTGSWIGGCCAGAVLLGARVLKQRIVFPRGGYVELRTRPALLFILLSCFAAAVALPIFAIMWPESLRWVTGIMESRLIDPGFAIGFAIICLASGWREKSTLMMWFGFYLLCLAPLLWWVPVNNYERGAWLKVGVGAPLTLAGIVRLRSFLKANPRPVEMANG
jgi:hypothetical protein